MRSQKKKCDEVKFAGEKKKKRDESQVAKALLLSTVYACGFWTTLIDES